jgi:hypothetical protein
MQLVLKFLTFFSIAALFTSCGSLFGPNRATADAPLARKVLNHPKITLIPKQVSGRSDGASSYHNITSVAHGYSAKRSRYGTAPGGYTKLRKQMLTTMLYLADKKGYSFRVTSIAGGSHSQQSRHYAGIAFDVDMINGRRVGYRNPYRRKFMQVVRAKGATEVLGPGDRGHHTHLHIAWPR